MVESIKELRKLCQTSSRANYDAGKSDWRSPVLWTFSIYFTKLLLILGITPNQVTWLFLGLAIIASFLFMPGIYILTLIGLVCYYIYHVLDYCDGEVARYTKKFSNYGVYLDYMAHIIVNPLLMIGISIGAYFSNTFIPIPNYVFLIAGFSSAYFFMLNQFARLKKYEMYLDKKEIKVLKNLQQKYKEVKQRGWKEQIKTFFRFSSIDALVVFGILNILPVLVLIYSVLMPLQAIVRFRGELNSADTESS